MGAFGEMTVRRCPYTPMKGIFEQTLNSSLLTSPSSCSFHRRCPRQARRAPSRRVASVAAHNSLAMAMSCAATSVIGQAVIQPAQREERPDHTNELQAHGVCNGPRGGNRWLQPFSESTHFMCRFM
jgi:hypothetical protein